MRKFYYIFLLTFSLSNPVLLKGQDNTAKDQSLKDINSQGLSNWLMNEVFALSSLKNTINATKIKNEEEIKTKIAEFEKGTGIKVNIINYYNDNSFWPLLVNSINKQQPNVSTNDPVLNLEIIYKKDKTGGVIGIDIVCSPSQGLLSSGAVSESKAKEVEKQVMTPICENKQYTEVEIKDAKEAVIAGLDHLKGVSKYPQLASSACVEVKIHVGKDQVVCKGEETTLGADPILRDASGVELTMAKNNHWEIKWYDENGNKISDKFNPNVSHKLSNLYTAKLFKDGNYQCEEKVNYTVLNVNNPPNMEACIGEEINLSNTSLGKYFSEGAAKDLDFEWIIERNNKTSNYKNQTPPPLIVLSPIKVKLKAIKGSVSCERSFDINLKKDFVSVEYNYGNGWEEFNEKKFPELLVKEGDNLKFRYKLKNENCGQGCNYLWKLGSVEKKGSEVDFNFGIDQKYGQYLELHCNGNPIIGVPVWVLSNEVVNLYGESVIDETFKFLYECWGSYKEQKEGIVPRCLWIGQEKRPFDDIDRAVLAGIIDAAFDDVKSTYDIFRFIKAWDMTGGLFFTKESEEIRRTTISIIAHIHKNGLPNIKDQLIKSLNEFAIESYGWDDPQARYNQGKAAYNIVSMCFAVGEITALIRSGKLISRLTTAVITVSKLPSKIPQALMKLIHSWDKLAIKYTTLKFKYEFNKEALHYLLKIDNTVIARAGPHGLENIQWSNGTVKEILHATDEIPYLNASGEIEKGVLGIINDEKGFIGFKETGKVSKLIVGKYSRSIIDEIPGFSDNLSSLVKREGLTMEQFQSLRQLHTDNVNKLNLAKINNIRNSIPNPDINTLMQKVIHESEIEKYLSGTWKSCKGYVTTAGDSKHLKTINDIYYGMRLDYSGSLFNKSREKIGIIRFKADNINEAFVPRSPSNGGKVTDGKPFTGNGFTAGNNSRLGIPEWKMENWFDLQDGAELWELLKDGTEKLKAIYSKKQNSFIPVE